MPPRGQGRRKITKPHHIQPSGKIPTKKSIKSSSPSITLNEILNSLSITFDKDLGILNGDNTRVVPELSTLEGIRKLFVKLNDQLEIVSNHDELMIEECKRLLKTEAQDDEDEEMDEEVEDDDVGGMETRGEVEEVKDKVDDQIFTAEATPIEKVEVEENNNNNNNNDDDDDDDDNHDVKMEDNDGDDDDGDNGDVDDDDDDNKGNSPEKEVFLDAKDQIGDEIQNDSLVDLPKDEVLSEKSKRRLSHQEEIENDPKVRNPKSEFVTSQTLPAAAHALGLFSEENGGLEEFGEEFLKKKYGVSSYPTNDLKSKLPGSIPNIDFSKSKPSNQVQFTTFQSFIENFYRPFTEDDLKFLKNKFIMTDSLSNDPTYDANLTPYLIPNLGPLYSTVWNEEENSGNYSPPPTKVTQDSILPKASANELNDDVLETESVSCGPLVSRLLSAILKDDRGDGGTNDDLSMNDRLDDGDDSKTSTTTIPEQQGWKVSSVNADYNTLEERLKRELKYIGIFMNLGGGNNNNNNNTGGDNKDDDIDDQEPDWLNPQDDEVSTELRYLQNELKQVSKKNNKRKKMLLPIVENQLAWQEYLSILDDLDKQVDNAYLKRIRVPKNKKKKTTGFSSSGAAGVGGVGSGSVPPSVQLQLQAQQAHQAAANSAVKSLLEKRNRWINKIGPLFEKPNGESMKRIPKESVFGKLDLDEEDDDDYEDGEDLVLQQQQ